jgi:hypothetical protein
LLNSDLTEYKLIYRAYSHSQLVGRQGVMRDQEAYEARSEAQYVSEAQDWSDVLNESAKEGFTVKDSGALQLAEGIVFWALMEKP